jgi:phosphatidylinositol alpha-1,6-mannosyltransferase
VPSLLVTNDFPPKHGGIQSVLWELWRRLPASETTVLTTPFRGSRVWDAEQDFRIERTRRPVLLPTPFVRRDVDELAREVAADVIFVDPMLPLGEIGPRLDSAPYVVIAHGAEVSMWGRVPPLNLFARRVLRDAAGVLAIGEYPLRESLAVACGPLPALVVPPGVDAGRFTPSDAETRAVTRKRFGLDPDRPVVLGLSRLVRRKGFDVLIRAVARLGDEVQLAIGGAGRDERRLRSLAASERVPVHFLGRIDDADLPAVYGSADVFAMLCRDRWRGLEAEGFGIVFLEAAACGVPQIAGRSGGAHEAVSDGETGFVVEPDDVDAVRQAIARLVDDEALRARMGAAARRRAVEEFSYERLVARLAPLARGDFGCLQRAEPSR